MLIHHVALESHWREAEADGHYTWSSLGATLEQEGFIHCSQDHQLAGVLERYYAGVSDPLVDLVIDTDRLASPWQLDPVPGSPDPYPHVYGPIDVDAVVDVVPVVRDWPLLRD